MQKSLNNKLAAQMGEYLVCAELARRGLVATSFTGNVPEFDLIVADDMLTTIPIQVKSSRGDSWPSRADKWIKVEIDHKAKKQIDHGDVEIASPDLIYVCVALAEADSGERDRFFVLRKSDLQNICAGNYRNWMNGLKWKRPRNYQSLDNRYYVINLEPYENNWALVVDQLQKRD